MSRPPAVAPAFILFLLIITYVWHVRLYIRGVSGEPSILIYSFIWSALKFLVFNYIIDHAYAHYKIFLVLDYIIIVK